MEKFTEFISCHPRLVLFITTLLLVPSAIGYKTTAVNYDTLTYLPQNLKSTEGQGILDRNSNNTATEILILEETNQDAEKFREEILEINRVEDVISKSSIMGNSVPDEFLPDNIKDVFYAGDSTLMLIKFKGSASSFETMSTIDRIKNLESKEKYLNGISPLVKSTKDIIDKETPIYVALAVVLGLIVLALTNESTFIPFIFVLTIGYAVAYNFGTNTFLREISYITKAIVAILQLIVTMDYSIFLYHRYVEEKEYKGNRNAAMDVALRKTISSLFASSLTTSASFIVLILVGLSLGKDIDLIIDKGVVIGLLTTVAVLPAMLLLVEKLVLRYNHKVLLPSFDRLSEFNIRHKRIIFMVFLRLFIPTLIGSSNIKVHCDLNRSPPRNLDSTVALKKIKKDYNMTTTHFIVAKGNLFNTILDSSIDELEEVDRINPVLGANTMTGVTLPEGILPQKVTDNFVRGGYKMIMVNSKYRIASEEVKAQIREIRRIINRYNPEGYLIREVVLTGDLTVISNKDSKRVNIVPIVVVFLIIALAFKSFGIPIILIATIELAIQINMGLPFYMGQTIPFITSITVGVIQLGSTIDYSILVTNHFLAEYQTLGDVDRALKLATRETSKSVVASGLSSMAATIGVGFYFKTEIVSTICTFLTRGAVISMTVIILFLLAVISVSFPLIKKITRELS